MIYFVLFILFLVFMPHSAYAWGPGVHIGVSINILDKLNPQTASMLLANLNEYLYGSLAPDFVIGKKYSKDKRHTHNWDIGFDILNSSTTDSQKAFALGYLTHLAADAAAHGILIPSLTQEEKHKNVKHFYIETLADIYCDNSYKSLAKRVLKRYNKKLDVQFKFKVDSVLFSFSVSKALFRGMSKITFNRKFERVMLNRYFIRYCSVQAEFIKGYIELSERFAIDVADKLNDSEVVKISAISR